MNTNPDALAKDMVIMLLADDDALWDEMEALIVRARAVARSKHASLYPALIRARRGHDQ